MGDSAGERVAVQGNEAPSNNESCPKLLLSTTDKMSSPTCKESKQGVGTILLSATEVRVGYL